jgi:hypothetical protein
MWTLLYFAASVAAEEDLWDDTELEGDVLSYCH